MKAYEPVSQPLARGIELCLILLLLFSPLIISTQLKQVFNTPKYTFVGFLAVLLGCFYSVDCLFERRLRLPAHPASWCLIGFILFGGLSMLWASDMAVASRDFGYHASMLSIFLAAFVYGRLEDRVDNLLHFPIAAGVIAAGYGFMQYFGLDERLFRILTVWPVLTLGGGFLLVAGLARSSTNFLTKPAIYLSLLAGVAAGVKAPLSQFLGLTVLATWFFFRFDSRDRLGLGMRLSVALMLLLLSSLLTPTVLLLLAPAILLDDSLKREVPEDGPVYLGVFLISAAITAAILGWDLTFLILPKKPLEAVKIYSFMGHRNYLAGFLIAVIPLVVVRIFGLWAVVPANEQRGFSLQRIWRLGVYFATLLLMATAVVLCQTRGAWIGGMASLGFMFVIWVTKYSAFRAKSLLGMVLGSVALLACLFGFKQLSLPGGTKIENPLNLHPKSAGFRLSETFNIQGGSAFQRALIYRTTWRIIFDHWFNTLFGTGLGTFGLHYMPAQKYVLQQPKNAKYLRMSNKSIYAHNEYWHYWSEVGVIGIFLLFGFLYGLGSIAQRRLLEEPPGIPNLMFLGMCGSLVATSVHNFFTFDFHLAYSGGIFFCLAGIVLAQADGRFWNLSFFETPVRQRAPGGAVEVSFRPHSDEGLRFDCWVRESLLDPDQSQGIILISPQGRKTPLDLDRQGRIQVVRPLETGTWKVQLDGISSELKDLLVEVLPQDLFHDPDAPTSNLEKLCLFVGLAMVCAGAVGMVQGLANEVLRDYYWRNGFLKFRLKRFEEAFLDYERAVHADPTKGEVLFDFGRALMDSQRNQPAIKVFRQAKATFVDPANDHNVALCYYKEKQPDKAEEHYRKALTLNPIYEQSLTNLSFMLLQRAQLKKNEAGEVVHDDMAEAEELLLRGYRVYPWNNRFASTLGVLYAKKRDLDKAREWFTKALEREPESASLWLNLGSVELNSQNFDAAEKALLKTKELDPKNQHVPGQLALVQVGRWGTRAQQESQNLEVRRNFALALLSARQYANAARECRLVLAAYPQDPVCLFTLGRALESLGQGPQALAEYQKLLSLPGVPPELKVRAEARVQELSAGAK